MKKRFKGSTPKIHILENLTAKALKLLEDLKNTRISLRPVGPRMVASTCLQTQTNKMLSVNCLTPVNCAFPKVWIIIFLYLLLVNIKRS